MLKGVVENDDKAWKEFYLYLVSADLIINIWK